MNLKYYPCDWCGSTDFSSVIESGDYLTDLPGKFTFVRCNKCGLLRQNPRLEWEDLIPYYKEDFPSHTPQITEIDKTLKRIDQQFGLWKRVNFVSRFKTYGKWLDVGCGTGRLLQEAQRWNKWHLFGLEPIPNVAEYTKSKLKIPIYSTTLEKFNCPDESFDIITMWDVLEHLPEPTEDIAKVSRILKRGGFFIFSIPNLNSIERKVFKQSWIGYELPRHLYLFPNTLLREILNSFGVHILTSKCIAGSHGTLMLDLARWNREKNSKFVSYITNKGANYFPFRLISFLPIFILDRLKLCTNITFAAKKL